MRSGRSVSRNSRPAGSRPWLVGTAAIVATFTILLPLVPEASAGSYGTGDPVSWTNGMVLCQFAAHSPSANVSALGRSGTGVTFSVLNVSEVRPNESVAAAADFGGASWTASNLTTEEAYDLSYWVHVPLVAPSDAARPLGSTNLSVDFVLPAYQGSPVGPTDAVNVVLSVVNWTWQAPNDHLVVTFEATPSFPTTEHLNATFAPGWLLASTSNASGIELERVGANVTATVTTTAGSTGTIPANASLALLSPARAQVTVAFGTASGAIRSFTYVTRVGVILPTSVGGIPLDELAAVGTAGVLVSVLVAATARRLRRKPSKLIYVTEEEAP